MVTRPAPSGTVKVSELRSACTTPGYGAADRADRVGAGLRSVSTGQVALSWISRTSIERYRTAGANQLIQLDDQEAALERVGGRQRRLEALGAIHLWRTVSSEQIAAIIGSPLTGSRRSVDLRTLLAAGLVQRGSAFAGTRRGIVTDLWRPDILARSIRFEDRLSYGEWLGVYAGQEWSWGAQAGWHNLLATELSLRVAELTPIGTVLGELLAGERQLFPDNGKLERSRRSADAVWVRSDGLRIVVEATATATASLRQRVDRWIEALLADDERSTVVLFVDVSDPDNHLSRPDRLMRRALVNAATATPERVAAGIAERLCFARYRDWFPGLGIVHPSFLGLRVERPTGKPAGRPLAGTGGGPGSRWEPVDLLDPYAVPFTPDDPEAALAPIVHAGNLYGVPAWLRGPGLDLEVVIRRLAGFPPPERLTPERKAELVARLSTRTG